MADADFAVEAPRQRRRIGVLLLIVVVVLLAAQSHAEWLLPYDMLALARLQSALGLPSLTPQSAALAWGLACIALLLPLRGPAPAFAWSALAGAALGTARLAAGGSVPAMVLMLMTGVATLGWQSRRHGGLVLLAATGASIVAWDLLLSTYATLWPFVVALSAIFVWIERHHLQATDQRLLSALRDLRLKREQLLALQHERTHLLAGIGHDLRQPVWAVRLYAEALLGRAGAPPDPEILRQQVRAADDALGMLDSFSEFAAIEQGALAPRPERTNLREAIAAVAQQLAGAHRGDPVDIRVHGRDAWVRTDRMQVMRIVQNLAVNAVRHALQNDGRSARARVVLGLRPREGGWAIEVIDNGAGIPADQLERVFEPYRQLGDERARRPGRGLGLAIVRGLSAQLGFAIAPVCSTPGRGTRFRVLVPAALACAAPAPAAERPLSGLLVAVLDDDDGARSAMQAALQAAGAACVVASALPALVERLDDEVRFPDALLFDHDLGGPEDGVAAVRRLREAWQIEVPALIVSGHAARRTDLPARCDMLAKAVGMAALVDALEALVRGVSATRHHPS